MLTMEVMVKLPVIHIISTKKTYNFLRTWVLQVIASPLLGPESYLKVLVRLIPKALIIIMKLSMNYWPSISLLLLHFTIGICHKHFKIVNSGCNRDTKPTFKKQDTPMLGFGECVRDCVCMYLRCGACR